MKSKVLSSVVLLLAVVLFGLLFVNHRQEQRQTAHMQQLQKEARSYEQEINDIRSEFAQKQRTINTKEDTSGILVGFVPASADDFAEIDKLAAEHSITSVILLDCSQEKEQLTRILKKAVAKDYEVVLAGLQFDESILQTVDEMKDSFIERFMTLADDRKAANELRYVDLNSAFQAVADQNATRQERQEAYEKYEVEQKKSIQELEEKISAIYSRWDEY